MSNSDEILKELTRQTEIQEARLREERAFREMQAEQDLYFRQSHCADGHPHELTYDYVPSTGKTAERCLRCGKVLGSN